MPYSGPWSISWCEPISSYATWSEDPATDTWVWHHQSLTDDWVLAAWFASPFYSGTIYHHWHACLDARFVFRVSDVFAQAPGTQTCYRFKPEYRAELLAPWIGVPVHAAVVGQAETGEFLVSTSLFWVVQ